MSQTDCILEASGLHKSFGTGPARVHVLRGLDLRVRRGEFLAVMGPSGCGKSTLLHVLGLMADADAGHVRFDGRDVTALGERARAAIRREKIGFVFQRFNLLGVLSGYDNIVLSLKIRGLRCDGKVRELLESMGVFEAARRKPAQLSIGEQQRLAVARALVHSPEVLLADEPTGSLDSEHKAALLELLRQANRDRGQTIVMITHSAGAAAAADRIAQMKDGVILDGNS
jgi:putative ABC transport system ATP-binding protein